MYINSMGFIYFYLGCFCDEKIELLSWPYRRMHLCGHGEKTWTFYHITLLLLTIFPSDFVKLFTIERGSKYKGR